MRALIKHYHEEYIRNKYLKCTGAEMARTLGLPKYVVGQWMRKNGLSTPKEIVIKSRSAKNIKPFTEVEDKFIEGHIHNKSIKWIAKELRRTSNYVSQRAKQLGYSEVISKKALESRIKPGTIPINKGKRQEDYMSPEALLKSKASRFKKGHIPHNSYNEIGKISIRRDKVGKPYKFICISLGNWVLFHKYQWENKNGKIPKGYCLWFKDGNSLNCELSNLELITRAENMVRNSLSDGALASRMARTRNGSRKWAVDEELKNTLITQHPEILDLKRHQLILQKELKKQHQK